MMKTSLSNNKNWKKKSDKTLMIAGTAELLSKGPKLGGVLAPLVSAQEFGPLK